MSSNSPVLAFGSDNPADLLGNAASVTRFLADVAPAFVAGGQGSGLTDESANGLCLILMAVDATITEALSRLG